MSRLLVFISILLLSSCQNPTHPDLLIINADAYTVEPTHATAQTIAVKDGKILSLDAYDPTHVDTAHTRVIDANGAFVMPGFIEGHGHFSGLGFSQLNLNFLTAPNWTSITQSVAEAAAQAKPGEWIEGRGWHQEKWNATPPNAILGYPRHASLSALSPNNPVILYHASGHSLYANAAAMQAAGISVETPNPAGGLILRDENGQAIGVFEERAMKPIMEAHKAYKDSLSQDYLTQRWHLAIRKAQDECLRKGITSFQDAGSKYFELDRYEQLARDGQLDLRLWAMARHTYDEMKDKVGKYRKIGVGNNFYTCRAIKSEVDGALGAYGAWLLAPYSDKAGWHGQNTTDIYDVRRIADLALTNDMQLCVHAIGDRANRVVVDIYEGMIKQMPAEADPRWRVEHAQHLDPADIPRFAEHKIIASMQGIHCTSDAPFVVKRLGEQRSKQGAYAWRSLLDAGVLVANGTDAPVEDVDPIPSFYASVTRKRADGGEAFFPEQSMSRAEAIHSYTLGNAYAAFEEDIKGSISIGKVADLVILDRNLLTCPDDDILDTKVLYTIVDGQVKYRADEE